MGELSSGTKSKLAACSESLHKKVQKQIPATTDQSAFSQSSARLWNPSSLQTLNPSSSPMAWFPIINLASDQATLPWICCFCSPINGWRSSMPDRKSEPYPWTYQVLLTRSGTLSCSPNSLPMVLKAISTHSSQTSSPVAVNAWFLLEFSHLLFLSRLEFLKAVFWALFFFWFSSMISPTLWKILYISLLMTPPSAVPSVIPQTSKQQLLRSLLIWIKSQTGPTRGTCLSIRTNLTLTMSLRKDHLEPPPPPHLLSQQSPWRSPFIQAFGSHYLPWSFLRKPHLQGGLQSQLPTGHPISCKVLPWHTWASNHLQSFHLQSNEVLFPPLGWCSCLTPTWTSCCGN